MRFSILLLIIGLNGCGQQPINNRDSINPEAKKFNDSASSIIMHTQDYDKAIDLLDQAIKIDSNYYLAFSNKVTFQLALNQIDKALLTAKNLNRIKPSSPDYFVSVGLIYDKIGDTVSSQKYFKKAVVFYDKIVDTINKANKNYDMLLFNKAVNLKFIGKEKEGNEILKELYDKSKDEFYKEMIDSLIKKSKQQLLDDYCDRNNNTEIKEFEPSLHPHR